MAMAFLVHVAVLSSLFPLSTATRMVAVTGLLLEKDVLDSKPAHAEKPDVLDEHQQEHITEHHSSGLTGTVAKPVLANVLGDHVNPVKMPTVAQHPDKDLSASRLRSLHAELLHKVLEDRKQEHSKENHRTGLIGNKVKPVTVNDSTLEVNQVNTSADLNATSAHAPRFSGTGMQAGFAHLIPTALLMLFREPDHDVRTLRMAIIVLLLLVAVCGLCWMAEFFKARQNERHSLPKRRTSISSSRTNASWNSGDPCDEYSDKDENGASTGPRGSMGLKAFRGKIKRGYKSARTAMSPGSSTARPEPEGFSF